MVILGVALLCFALAFFSACVMACWKMPSWSLTDGHEPLAADAGADATGRAIQSQTRPMGLPTADQLGWC